MSILSGTTKLTDPALTERFKDSGAKVSTNFDADIYDSHGSINNQKVGPMGVS